MTHTVTNPTLALAAERRVADVMGWVIAPFASAIRAA